ncbi:hypothetical protein [Paraburkholderia panacisoli]|uniref:hypothetical protein n=1 Tax=Paraburkholderia panacisoli TaxID=2603818 RepID=UPI00165EE42D|nr:hypothetical protein [Paraburkholderia panacisoli]
MKQYDGRHADQTQDEEPALAKQRRRATPIPSFAKVSQSERKNNEKAVTSAPSYRQHDRRRQHDSQGGDTV